MCLFCVRTSHVCNVCVDDVFVDKIGVHNVFHNQRILLQPKIFGSHPKNDSKKVYLSVGKEMSTKLMNPLEEKLQEGSVFKIYHKNQMNPADTTNERVLKKT